MVERLDITKTYKLFIGGQFPRSESGRTLPIHDGKERVIAHVCRGSRKDLREAVEAARKAAEGWADSSAYLRGQILYRMAEMLEGRREEFAASLAATTELTPAKARREVDASVDRLVAYAGWTDKFQQVLGCHNPVAGPYYNFTIPEPTGIVGVIAPPEPPLLGLVTLLAAPVCAGNTVVIVASEPAPLPAVLLAEICPTSDIPGGVVNIITGHREELLPPMAEHREISAISGAHLSRSEKTLLRTAAAGNIKRVHVVRHTHEQWLDDDIAASPWCIEPFLEMKTIWHPSAT